MCEYGTTVPVRVKVPADLSCSGAASWKEVQIDFCIAPIIKALQDAEIDMRGSCCGHSKGLGSIHLQDGRELLVLSKESFSIRIESMRLAKIRKGGTTW